MNLLAHFVIALVPVAGYSYLRAGSLPAARLVGVVFVGCQFPDLIDKPLAHQFFLLPSGRVFTHSLPVAIPVSLAILAGGVKTDRLNGSVVFVFAYLSHIAADTLPQVLATGGRLPADLFWPLTAPEPSAAIPAWAGPGAIYVELWTIYAVVVLSVTLSLVGRDLYSQPRHR